MMIVSAFSRKREFRADAGGASLSNTANMISALEKLKLNLQLPQANDQPAVASLKISGKAGGMLRLFSTHPDLDDRIQALRKSQTIGMM